MPSVEELKKRKIVQWALAYLAGAWVVVQILDVVAEPWGIAPDLLLAAQIVLAFGFFATLVLAWYHGEQGRQRVSGPELLMLAALLVIAGGVIAVVRGDGEATAADAGQLDAPGVTDSIPERSIAVLPLDNLSPAEEHAYFAGAMTEAITNALEEVPTFRVISRNSAARFTEFDMTVGDFAREELGVAYVIEGSVQREGDRALITVQLIETATDEHVWSETYDERVVDIIDVQVDIARQVAEQLAATFTERDRRRIAAGATDDPVAFDLYLEAMEHPVRTREEFEERLDLLRRAVEVDSTFARAWASLGGLYWFGQMRLGQETWSDSSRSALDQARRFVSDSALRADIRRLTALRRGEREEYLDLVRRAVHANPSDVDAASTLGNTYWAMGDLPKAVEWRRYAIELDPLDPGKRQGLGYTYALLALDSLSEWTWRRAIELGDGFAWRGLVDLNLLRGDFDAAQAAVDSLRRRDDPWADLYEGRVHLWAGEGQRAHGLLTGVSDEVLADAYFWAGPSIAHTYLAEGDTARAHELLRGTNQRITAMPDPASSYLRVSTAAVRSSPERATQVLREYVEAGGREARWIRNDPVFARVRADSAFEAELARLEEIVERQRRQVERDLAEER